MLFKAPKENTSNDAKLSAEKIPSTLKDEVNKSVSNIENYRTINMSHEYLTGNAAPLDDRTIGIESVMSNNRSNRTENASNRSKENFQGVPKCAPVSIGTLGLRMSPRIEAQKKNKLDPTLNHVGFNHAHQFLEVDEDPSKETFTFKKQ